MAFRARVLSGSQCLSRSVRGYSAFASNTTVFKDVPPLRAYRNELLKQDRTVGLVPTMGALHEGHTSLVRMAAAENTDVFVSIYVNPTQFGVNEDFASYPQTLESDLKMLQTIDRELASTRGSGRISAIFAPNGKTMYPTLLPSSEIDGQGSFVTITPLATLLEGATRPVFFRGVATVCTKLFNICTPDRVYFGQKDVQQTIIIRRMVKDFHIGTEVRIGATKREEDGLALSSRNVYLGARRRAVGTVLSQTLMAAESAYLKGHTSRSEVLGAAEAIWMDTLKRQKKLQPSQRALFEVIYVSLADPDTLEEIDVVDETKGAVLSGAIKMLPIEDPQPREEKGQGDGKVPVRLIDNILLPPRA
ncbi:pantoate-beta-alanine ligase [Pseudovirgaria hyperparasitica]|uniref:Pantoate--beta-alanine ligase n=1 Tax=Pseudovirgaria hyperparasitica TaxID=470096 RepID=A0A6A6W001_9PEZI|nr:pantoate-beta-alanine ligase [Pseudovirgaria hyperparasitica]KAF2755314.1 pantoate-beta-alanine ligase [Pseudovirgaria hyperparasitica]